METPRWLAAACAATLVSLAAAPRAGAEDEARARFESLLEFERTSEFTATQVTEDYWSDGQVVVTTEEIVIFEGRKFVAHIDTTGTPAGERFRGADSPDGSADLTGVPVPVFPEGISNLDRLFRNHDFILESEDETSFRYRIAPKSYAGYGVLLEVSRLGPWVGVSISDA